MLLNPAAIEGNSPKQADFRQDKIMNKHGWIAAGAAMLMGVFQGCDSRSATAPGDRSTEGMGIVAFRLSESNASTLRQTSVSLKVQVNGPGLTVPVQRLFSLDSTDIVLEGIPAGTRYVRVAALDLAGNDVWVGTDTVEIYRDSTSTAHIVLRRAPTPTGQLRIDLTLDNGLDSIPYVFPNPLHDGPQIGLDSFSIREIGRMRSTRFNFPSGWQAIGAGDLLARSSYGPHPDNVAYAVLDDTSAILRAKGDSGSEIVSGFLPADWQGTTLALAMPTTQDPLTSGWDRSITVEDSLGNGMVLRLDGYARAGGSDSMVKAIGSAYDSSNYLVKMDRNGNYFATVIPWGADSSGTRPANWNPMASSTWYFSWNAYQIVVRSEQGIVGVVSNGAGFRSFGSLRVRIKTVSKTGVPVYTMIPLVKLYRGY